MYIHDNVPDNIFYMPARGNCNTNHSKMALLVKTKSGTGKVVGEMAGKAMVEILNGDGSTVIKGGKPLRVLVSKNRAVPIGFIDGGMDFDEAFFSNTDTNIKKLEIPTNEQDNPPGYIDPGNNE